MPDINRGATRSGWCKMDARRLVPLVMADDKITYLNSPGAEARLIEGLRAGDEDCYRHLYAIFAPRLRRMLTRIWKDPQLANDAVQASFLIVFRRIDQFSGRSSLFTWITRIALREAGRLARRTRNQDNEAMVGSVADLAPSPEDAFGTREQAERLRTMIDALPVSKRTALILFEVEEMSVNEIAEIMDEPRGTVLARLCRTRAELRELCGVPAGLRKARRPPDE
jgi:RNA polymerase sigma-70 factor, ECF subfamily